MECLGIVCFFAACVLFFTCWTAIIVVCEPKHIYALWLGVPVLGLVLLVSLYFAVSFYQSLPSVVFRDITGLRPTTDVEFVNSLRHTPTDWDNSYLVMYASDSTITRILANGFTPIRPNDFDEYGCTPVWWKPPTGPSVRIYATDTNSQEFRDRQFRYVASYRLLIYDPEGGDPGRRKVYLRYRRP
jgi:hypothetical protein